MTMSSSHPTNRSEPDDPQHSAALQEYLCLLEQGRFADRPDWLAQHAAILPAIRGRLEALEVLYAVGPRLHSAAAELYQPASDATDRAETNAAALNTVLGEFRLLREIGRGGMGIVYEAEQASLGRRVAVKVLPFAAALEPKRLARFRQEAQAAAHFYAMQLIEGRSLAAMTSELRGIPTDATPRLATSFPEDIRQPAWFETVGRLGIQAAEALHFAHELGIIHRDIKPRRTAWNLAIRQPGTGARTAGSDRPADRRLFPGGHAARTAHFVASLHTRRPPRADAGHYPHAARRAVSDQSGDSPRPGNDRPQGHVAGPRGSVRFGRRVRC
jgi:hypothetical protein